MITWPPNLARITQVLMELPLPGLRVLVVDDNSPDGTGVLAEQLADQYGRNRIGVVHRPGKEGLGRAYRDGMTQAIAGGAEFVSRWMLTCPTVLSTWRGCLARCWRRRLTW